MARIEEDVQVAVAQALRSCLLHHSHFSVVAGLPGQRSVYYFVHGEFYLERIANDIYGTVSSCSARVWSRVEPKRKRQLQLLPTNGPDDFIATEILGPPLPCNIDGNQYVVAMTDR